MTYKRLNLTERKLLSKLLKEKYSKATIAKILGRSRSSIYEEIKRCSYLKEYDPHKAELLAIEQSSLRKKGKGKLNVFLINKIEFLLGKWHWSPEQISARLKRDGQYISYESIYRYIYSCSDRQIKSLLINNLRRKKKYRGHKRRSRKRETLGKMTSIHDRPSIVDSKMEIGHWEGDLIIGKDHKSAILTLVERKTRFTFIMPLGVKKDSEAVLQALLKAFNKLPKELKKTLTYDRGSEMAKHLLFTQNTDIPVYFADSGSPWQMGCNENTNGLLREFFPKRTDLCKPAIEEFDRVQNLLNTRPRKVLGFDSPIEALTKELDISLDLLMKIPNW